MARKISKKKKEKLKRCEEKLKGKPGIDRFAVCRKAVLGGKK